MESEQQTPTWVLDTSPYISSIFWKTNCCI